MTQDATSAADLAGDFATKVSCQPGRIDFVWEPRALPPAFNSAEIPLDVLSEYLKNIGDFASTQPVSRVAVVFAYREKAASALEAVDRARSELGGIEIPVGSTEFTYRLNVPGQVDGFEINRIVTWQTSKVGFFGFTVGPVSNQIEPVFHDLWEKTIDVNTLQENPLASGLARDALKKAIEEASRVGELGLEAL